MAKVGVPPESIKLKFEYNAESGVFKDKVTGLVTKPTHSEGYHRVQYLGVRYFVHRLAYWWETNDWPDEVDHINRNTSDNRLVNLRGATQKQNSCNKGTRGRSKYRGVTWYGNNSKWGVTLRKDGVPYYLGLFTCEGEAALAYNYKAIQLHGDFCNLNKVFKDVSEEVADD